MAGPWIVIEREMLEALVSQGPCVRAPEILRGAMDAEFAPSVSVCPFCDAARILAETVEETLVDPLSGLKS